MKTQTCKMRTGTKTRVISKIYEQKQTKKNVKQEFNKKLKDLKTKHKRDPKQLTNNI